MKIITTIEASDQEQIAFSEGITHEKSEKIKKKNCEYHRMAKKKQITLSELVAVSFSLSHIDRIEEQKILL
jgi:hypothetical protein